jgi:hypothetical protein
LARLAPLGVFLLLAAIGALAFYGFLRRRELATKDWPTTPATIISSQIIRTTQAHLRTSLQQRTQLSPREYEISNVWAVDVEYRYQAGGGQRTGHKATSTPVVQEIGKKGAEPGKALQDLSAQLPAGATVDTHYDPANPDNSYLIYRDDPGIASILTLVWILMGVGVALIVVARISR